MTLGVVLAASPFLSACQRSCVESLPTYAQKEATEGAIAIIGDIQGTTPFFAREQNERERALLIASIAQERPSLVVILGDMVFQGSSPDNWADLDLVLAPIRQLKIPILPAPGNHEYRGVNALAMSQFHARFPLSAQSHWYRQRHGKLGLVWLDSNQRDLESEKWKVQQQWFKQTLQRLDTDAKIRGVFVFTHHPPYTNTVAIDDERYVQDAFIEPFMKARKTLAFFSGHAHGYERFIKNGKHFIVSAGGGGARVRYLNREKIRYRDQYRGAAPRPFNYVVVTQTQTGAKVITRGLDKGKTEIKPIDSVDIPFP